MPETTVAKWSPKRLPAGWRCVQVQAFDHYGYYGGGRLGPHEEREVIIQLQHESGIEARLTVNGIPDEGWLIQYLTVLTSMPLAVKHGDASGDLRRDMSDPDLDMLTY